MEGEEAYTCGPNWHSLWKRALSGALHVAKVCESIKGVLWACETAVAHLFDGRARESAPNMTAGRKTDLWK